MRPGTEIDLPSTKQSDTFDGLLPGIVDTQQTIELGSGQDFIDVRRDATQT
jgi:hypothetical protein